ncbi:MAG: bacillithiol biosynthesis deacetylase BshB1 [Planctomycetes bacterium]|nr:bacillithiol biosynthesis deacetylase BshB1 [Planctomycetota bacterium]
MSPAERASAPPHGVDVLAVGAHPDDVEIGCGGTVLRVTRGGGTAVVVDLSAGECATRGTAETRAAEAVAAARVLGIAARENLGLPDGAIADDPASRHALVAAIRRHRPRILLAPHPDDDHPDHAAAARLAVAASFLAGVGGIAAEGARHRAAIVLFYLMHRRFAPALIVDISDVHDEKLRALRSYRSQLHDPAAPGPRTHVGAPDFLDRLRARDRFFGEAIGVTYGEPFAARRPPGLRDLRLLVGGSGAPPPA